MTVKVCTKCNKEYPATTEYFYKKENGKYNLMSICKLCHNKYVCKFVKTKRGKEVQRKSGFKSDYNITLEQYDKMFEDQNGVCMICGDINKNGRRLCVDHNHKTGKVRALLCDHCNILLGFAKENVTILHSMVNYLGDINETQTTKT